MKKISFIIPSFQVGGTESSFIRMANSFNKSEFQSELVYWFEGGELREREPGVIITKIKVTNLLSLLFRLIGYYNKTYYYSYIYVYDRQCRNTC